MFIDTNSILFYSSWKGHKEILDTQCIVTTFLQGM